MLKLDINLLFEIINLIIFYLLLKKFLFGPIQNIMDKRKNLIEGGLDDAKKKQQEAESLKDQYESALTTAHEKSRQIVADATSHAKSEYDRIMKDAGQQANELKAKAQLSIEAEREKTLRDLKAQVAVLAMQAAIKVTGDAESSVNDLKLYDQFLEETGEAHGTNS